VTKVVKTIKKTNKFVTKQNNQKAAKTPRKGRIFPTLEVLYIACAKLTAQLHVEKACAMILFCSFWFSVVQVFFGQRPIFF